jgi:succinate dehydrogenase/fumarate reductase flavoprotein subunit
VAIRRLLPSAAVFYFKGDDIMADNSRAKTDEERHYDAIESISKPRSIGQLTVDLDCAEALTGLKAIQREAKKATQALRELEDAQKRISEVSADE